MVITLNIQKIQKIIYTCTENTENVIYLFGKYGKSNIPYILYFPYVGVGDDHNSKTENSNLFVVQFQAKEID